MNSNVVRGLRSRGIDVMTATEARMIRRPDEDHLTFAAAQNRVLCSFNLADYHEIHSNWMLAGRMHAGIVLAAQNRHSVGEQIRRFLRLIGSVSAETMGNRVEFLGHW